ncbi:MAG TPA: hypothetical protein VGJ28_09200 [Micromonosporaceae bacterium]
MRTHAIFVAGLTAALALALAGCSGSSTPAASGAGGGGSVGAAPATAAAAAGGTAPDVCTLMPPDKVSTIIGHSYTAGKSFNGMCQYTTTDAPVPLTIIVYKVDAVHSWQDELGTIQEDGESPQPITGCGDKAAGGGAEFGCLSGNWIIDIDGGDPDGGTGFPKSIQIATAIIPQLH